MRIFCTCWIWLLHRMCWYTSQLESLSQSFMLLNSYSSPYTISTQSLVRLSRNRSNDQLPNILPSDSLAWFTGGINVFVQPIAGYVGRRAQMNAICFILRARSQLRLLMTHLSHLTQQQQKGKQMKQTVELLTHLTSSLLSSWNKLPMVSMGVLKFFPFMCPLMALGNTVSK